METKQTWALITGASSGIGKAVAIELAAKGYNVFLASNDDGPLQQTAADLHQQFNVETQFYLADLTRMESIEGLIQAVSAPPIEIEILINNAGFGVGGEFLKTDLAREMALVNLQLATTLKLTKAILPQMVARKKGRILNTASVYSFAPVPFQAVYSACKAFLFTFSESLRGELRGTGVTVTALCPGTVRTEFRSRAGIAHRNQSAGVTPEAVAKLAVRQTLRGKHLVVPGISSKFFVFCARRLPVAVVPRIVRYINSVRGVNK
ncbi:MAG TPA: SDR family oxidoreductase [Terriglobia bacterium]|nr:SDR family oxidoreductase [Terriglobia bacterium]